MSKHAFIHIRMTHKDEVRFRRDEEQNQPVSTNETPYISCYPKLSEELQQRLETYLARIKREGLMTDLERYYQIPMQSMFMHGLRSNAEPMPDILVRYHGHLQIVPDEQNHWKDTLKKYEPGLTEDTVKKAAALFEAILVACYKAGVEYKDHPLAAALLAI